MIHFNKDAIRPGDILHVRTYGLVGKTIRYVLGSWGNHDALLDFDADGNLMVLEHEPPRSKITPAHVYEKRMREGKAECIVYRPTLIPAPRCAMACEMWRERLHKGKGVRYDDEIIRRKVGKAGA